MHSTSVPLLLAAAGTVGFLHSILPDHWVPLAVIARTQRWSVVHTARISLLASVGHVLTSIVLGGIIAVIGLQFRSAVETQQSHIVGVVLILTGVGFAVWGFIGHGHHEHDHAHDHHHGVGHSHEHPHERQAGLAGDVPPAARIIEEETQRSHEGTSVRRRAVPGQDQALARRLTGIAVPFGAAASPDLTILPVFLAASAVGLGTVIGVLTTFSAVTLTTFVVLTVAATLAGYQVKGEWLEENGNTITAAVLTLIGIAVYLNVF